VVGTLHAVGGPPPGADRPLPGEISAKRGSDGTGVGVGADGEFSIQLASGTYTIVGRSPQYNGGNSDCFPVSGNPVTITGATTHVDVVCQIR
jgi:hypothetical protein